MNVFINFHNFLDDAQILEKRPTRDSVARRGRFHIYHSDLSCIVDTNVGNSNLFYVDPYKVNRNSR
jgi:hypothetical protein